MTCKTCNGTGLVNDAEPGDISYNVFQCPDCEGRKEYKRGYNAGLEAAAQQCLHHYLAADALDAIRALKDSTGE